LLKTPWKVQRALRPAGDLYLMPFVLGQGVLYTYLNYVLKGLRMAED
jgi:hypothetical protein